MNDGAQREMSLEEFCGRLPPNHRVNKELSALKIRLEDTEELLESTIKELNKALETSKDVQG